MARSWTFADWGESGGRKGGRGWGGGGGVSREVKMKIDSTAVSTQPAEGGTNTVVARRWRAGRKVRLLAGRG